MELVEVLASDSSLPTPEDGKINPSVATIALLVEALLIDPADLLTKKKGVFTLGNVKTTDYCCQDDRYNNRSKMTRGNRKICKSKQMPIRRMIVEIEQKIYGLTASLSTSTKLDIGTVMIIGMLASH